MGRAWQDTVQRRLLVRYRTRRAPAASLLRYTPGLRLLLLRYEVRDRHTGCAVVVHCRSGITRLSQVTREKGEWTATLVDAGWLVHKPPRKLLLWKGAASSVP